MYNKFGNWPLLVNSTKFIIEYPNNEAEVIL